MRLRSCYKSLRRRAARRSFTQSVSTDTDQDFAIIIMIIKNNYIDPTYKQSNTHRDTHTSCSHSQSFNATDFAQSNTLLEQL